MNLIELGHMGSYVSKVPEGTKRARELSREELRNLLEGLERDATLDSMSSGDVSATDAEA